MIRITTTAARKRFARVLKRARGGKRFLLVRHGRGVAAIVSLEDLKFLESAEDRLDVIEARLALAEIAEQGAIPWEQVKAELGLGGAGKNP